MIIDTTKPFSEQTEEVQQAIKDELQLAIIHINQSGEGYPGFDDDGGITITTEITDDDGDSFRLYEKRVQNKPFSQSDRSVKSRTYNIENI